MARDRSRHPPAWCARPLWLALTAFCLALVLGCATPSRADPLTAATTPIARASSVTPDSAGSVGNALTDKPSETNTALAPQILAPLILASWRREGRSVVLVDVRASSLCDQDRLSGALCIPSGELEARLSDLPRHGDIVVYGSGSGDAAEVRAGAQLLLRNGFENVYELDGGLADFTAATRTDCDCS